MKEHNFVSMFYSPIPILLVPRLRSFAYTI
jgi:hypothetical protein